MATPPAKEMQSTPGYAMCTLFTSAEKLAGEMRTGRDENISKVFLSLLPHSHCGEDLEPVLRVGRGVQICPTVVAPIISPQGLICA